jgi:hypothetical protein
VPGPDRCASGHRSDGSDELDTPGHTARRRRSPELRRRPQHADPAAGIRHARRQRSVGTPRQHRARGRSLSAARGSGGAGWHIEGSYAVGDEYWVNLASRERSLLLLVLLSDVGGDDAPTGIRVGSHLLVPMQLRAAGTAGMPLFESRRTHRKSRHAGDVYLCHPFLVNSATWPHRGSTPRFMAQPALPKRAAYEYGRPSGEYSPVELAVRIGLGLDDFAAMPPVSAPTGRGDRK